MRLLAHLLMKLFVLIVQSSVSYLFEMTIVAKRQLQERGPKVFSWSWKVDCAS
jgi:hypothetical protein